MPLSRLLLLQLSKEAPNLRYVHRSRHLLLASASAALASAPPPLAQPLAQPHASRLQQIRAQHSNVEATTHPDASLARVELHLHPPRDQLKYSVRYSQHPQLQLDRLVPELRAFYNTHGHWIVPSNYDCQVSSSSTSDATAPNTIARAESSTKLLPLLAQFLNAVRSDARTTQSVAQELQALGFPLERCLALGDDGLKRLRWQDTTLAALETYQALYGDLLVKRAFVVPTGDSQWPRSTWGLQLGASVHRLRAAHMSLPLYQRQDLDAIGFAWSADDARWHERFLPALRHFAAIHGHCRVPHSFVVPSRATGDGDETHERLALWPEHLRGYRLGQHVSDVRNGKYRTHVDANSHELEALGFAWNAYDDKWDHAILPALELFARKRGDAVVPSDFVVPRHGQDGWPASLGGLKLGQVVARIRSGHFASQAQRSAAALDAIGFSFDVLDDRWKTLVLPALQHFYLLYGHTYIPRDFVVPFVHQGWWPAFTQGFALGRAVHSIRRGDFAAQVARSRAELDAVEFAFNVADAKWDREVMPALRHYAAYYGHARVAKAFVVPTNPKLGWPLRARGLKLGAKVESIRRGGSARQVERSARELKALGVAPLSISPKIWRDLILPALETYATAIGSDEPVPTAFVVPREAPWPKPTWGFALGNSAKNMRQCTRAYAHLLRGDRETLRRLGLWWLLDLTADDLDDFDYED